MNECDSTHPNYVEPHMEYECGRQFDITYNGTIKMIATPCNIECDAPNNDAIQCIQINSELVGHRWFVKIHIDVKIFGISWKLFLN